MSIKTLVTAGIYVLALTITGPTPAFAQEAAPSADEETPSAAGAEATDSEPATEAAVEAAPEPAPEAAPATMETNVPTAMWQQGKPWAGYQKGFFIQAPEDPFKLLIQGRVQGRFTHEAIGGFGPDGESESQFSIPRARLSLKGHAFSKDVKYKFQMDFGKGGVSLKDFLVDYTLIEKWLHIRVGQWKKPFSRQQISSTGRLEFVDRAITDEAFDAGRDIGLMFHNGVEKSPTFEYAFGFFNGTGEKGWFSADMDITTATAASPQEDYLTGVDVGSESEFTNVPDLFKPLLAMRVGYNYGGIKGYREGDHTGGGFRFSLGAGAMLGFDAVDNDDGSFRAELDYAVKAGGFASTGEFFVAMDQDGEGFADQAFSKMGLLFQTSYMIAGRYQPALRFAWVAPDGEENDDMEIALGFSTYFFGHHLKWQNDFSALIGEQEGDDKLDFRFRSQLQLSF